MNKKVMSLVMAVIFALSATSLVFAGPDGNKRKGKYTYRNVYKACAARGEVKSETPPISPSDKTMAQWERVFEKKDFDVFGCKEEFSKLPEADLQDIYAYLYNYAADSPSPAKCK